MTLRMDMLNSSNSFFLLAAEDSDKWFIPILGLVIWALAAWDFYSGRASIGRWGLISFEREESPVGFFIIVGLKVLLGGFMILSPFLI